MTALVSVIIPAFQNASTLGRSIASISAQTRGDWEVIVACDGGTDGTLEIARLAAESDSRIRVLALEHGGVSRARNAAIAESKGEWLLFLDADDTVATNFIARMLGAARANADADIIACGYNRLDDLGRIGAKFRPLPLNRDALAVCAAGPPGAIHSFLVKRDSVVAVGGFDTDLRTNEDWDLWLRLAQQGNRFAVTRARLANYWSVANSLSRESEQMVRDASVVLERARALQVVPSRGLEAFDLRYHTIDELRLRNAMWSAGVAIGQGDPVPDLLGDIAPSVEYRYIKGLLATKLFDGLVVGTGVGYSGVALKWPSIRPGVEAFLERLRLHVGAETMRPIAEELQVLVARSGRYVGQIDFGHVLGVSLTLRMFLFGHAPQSTADWAIYRIYRLRPTTIFSFAAPLVGPMRGSDIRAAVWRGFTRRVSTRIAIYPELLGLVAHVARGTALARRALRLRRQEPPGVPVSHAARDLARAFADAVPQATGPTLPTDDTEVWHPGAGAGHAEWDRFFEREDPWDYGNDYEQVKYHRTLGLLTPIPEGRALEVACAEGRFTRMLAGIAGQVHALDISKRAIERAAARTAECGNVDFEVRDIFRDGIEGEWDLITCSEMLYFAPSAERVAWFAKQVAEALRPGGQFVHAHAFAVRETPGQSGFEWDNPISGQGIFETFAAVPGLRHARSIITELYRIDLFVRDDAAVAPAPQIVHMPLGAALTPELAAQVVWNGPVTSRAEAGQARTYRVPALLFHGMSEQPRDHVDKLDRQSFEHVLRYLRRRGYRSATPDEWRQGASLGGSMRGRAILLTFDGIDEDFLTRIWPLIRANGFGAHLLVTPRELEAIGEGDAGRVRGLIAQGISFGTRLMGVAADKLDSTALLRDAITARVLVSRMTGTDVTSVALPEGMSDTRIEQLLAAAGYDRAFLDEGEAAWVRGYEMRTPRIEITGDTMVEALAEQLPGAEPAEPGDLPAIDRPADALDAEMQRARN